MTNIHEYFKTSKNDFESKPFTIDGKFQSLIDANETQVAQGYLQAVNDINVELYKILSNFQFGKGGQLNGAHAVRTDLKKFIEHKIEFITSANSVLTGSPSPPNATHDAMIPSK